MSEKFTVLTVPSNRAFVVSSDKVEEFMNTKPDLEKRKEKEELVSKLNIRNDIPVKKLGSWKK
jgi:hypothetical protein